MKIAINIIFAVILVVSCQNQVSYEQQLYNCWVSSFNSKGIDIKNEVKSFEENLIENGYLIDSSGISYKNLIDSLSNAKTPMISRTIEMSGFLSNSDFVIKNCSELRNQEKNSKFSRLTNEFIKASKSKELGLNYVYRQISSEITQKDFETDLYKTWITWVLMTNSINPNALKSILPPKDTLKNVALTLRIDKQLNYYANKTKIDFKEIDLLIKEAATNPETKVGLCVDESVTMDKIVEIMNLCKKHRILLELKTDN